MPLALCPSKNKIQREREREREIVYNIQYICTCVINCIRILIALFSISYDIICIRDITLPNLWRKKQKRHSIGCKAHCNQDSLQLKSAVQSALAMISRADQNY